MELPDCLEKHWRSLKFISGKMDLESFQRLTPSYTQLAIYLPHTRRQGWSHSSFIGRRNMSQNPIICQVVMFVCNISWTMQWRTLALGRRVRVSAHPGWKPAGMGIWRRTSNLDPGEQLLSTDSTAILFVDPMGWTGNMKVHPIYWSADLIMKTDPPEAPLSYPPFRPRSTMSHRISGTLASTAFTAANVITAPCVECRLVTDVCLCCEVYRFGVYYVFLKHWWMMDVSML